MLRYFQPALKKTLLNVKQMENLDSEETGLGLGAGLGLGHHCLQNLLVCEEVWRDEFAGGTDPRGAVGPSELLPSELQAPQSCSPQSWQTVRLWNSSLSNLNLIAVGRQLKYECGEASTDRMLMIRKQRGSSNWNEVPLFMKLAWRGKSDGPNKRVLMEQRGIRSLNLALICSFSSY